MGTRFEAAVRIDGTPKPMTKKDLAAFEKLAGVPVPDGWRDFMLRHGRYFNLRGVAKRAGVTMTLGELVALTRDNLEMYVEQYGKKQKARLARLVPFGDTIGGDILAWDPGGVGRAVGEVVEYPVVMLRDDAKGIDELAPGFEAFLVDVCLSPRFGKIVGDRGWKVETGVRADVRFAGGRSARSSRESSGRGHAWRNLAARPARDGSLDVLPRVRLSQAQGCCAT